LQIAELHRLQVGQILVGDGADGQRGEIDLLGAAEVQQQAERALEGADAQSQLAGGNRLGRRLAGRLAHGVSFTASRTSAIVSWAIARARREPSKSTCRMVSGFSAKA